MTLQLNNDEKYTTKTKNLKGNTSFEWVPITFHVISTDDEASNWMSYIWGKFSVLHSLPYKPVWGNV